MNRTFSHEAVFQIFALVLAVILVHSIYVTVVYPNAEAILAQQLRRRARIRTTSRRPRYT
jgi:hypothetical protein